MNLRKCEDSSLPHGHPPTVAIRKIGESSLYVGSSNRPLQFFCYSKIIKSFIPIPISPFPSPSPSPKPPPKRTPSPIYTPPHAPTQPKAQNTIILRSPLHLPLPHVLSIPIPSIRHLTLRDKILSKTNLLIDLAIVEHQRPSFRNSDEFHVVGACFGIDTVS